MKDLLWDQKAKELGYDGKSKSDIFNVIWACISLTENVKINENPYSISTSVLIKLWSKVIFATCCDASIS